MLSLLSTTSGSDATTNQEEENGNNPSDESVERAEEMDVQEIPNGQLDWESLKPWSC